MTRTSYGFVKLIFFWWKHISLEEVARINPVYTKKFVDSALEDRLNNREHCWRTKGQ